MRILHLAFIVAFSIFLTETKQNPWFTEKLKTIEGSQRAAFQADEKGLTATARVGKISCLSPWGYCLLRKYQCSSGFVMKERFNNCPNTRTLKCCVL
ncbi:hypothetical protein JD844_025725 [Phrynosoma platyrhinos]|uniref:Uncharacterized protein n=1 Tax=Phrynosoma platyrhinos TaxID=52577 RepID=A0ABQ7SZY6_PHRPL|nr:hypothetical protein JD844_025725 [Phrynosoma platyrhinos]